MKRAYLVWFAAGAACSSIAAVSADLALREPAKGEGWFLTVAEEWQSQNSAREAVVWRGAEIARDCGARSFEMMPGYGADAVDATRVPLVKKNERAMRCIIEQANKAKLFVSVHTEAKSANEAVDWP